ncbi:MAG: 50S ribosomal protein L11 methyltransferase [Oscillospiraceae bacterium]|nr:50S ribosomal protein L11 methyltransferase [Oscillospiraceae bacterium]
MEWTEASIYTTSEGVELLCGKLLDLGINGFAVEDARDFETFLEETTPHWDYVEDSLMALKDAETRVIVYLPKNAQGVQTLAAVSAMVRELKSGDADGRMGRLEISCGSLLEEDWENNWKQYYKPLRVGRHLMVVPSWEPYEKQEKDILLKLDPGMAFGTGTHATTRLCMELLEQSVKPGCTLLDIGCGSGILAVCGVLLGAAHADGVDIDELAAKIAGENAALNGVSDRTHFVQGDLTDKINGQYDVICANIVADVIIRLCPSIPQFLKPDGTFLASGIIDERSVEVEKAIEHCGMTIAERREEGGWVALRCRFTEE